MTTLNLPVVSMLKTRMHWHQTRQKVLAENVANANTPGFHAKDLVTPQPAGAVGPVAPQRTSAMHLTLAGASGEPGSLDSPRTETRPSRNAVSLEDEMLKVAENQSDYQLAATLYQKSLAMLRTAVGGRG